MHPKSFLSHLLVLDSHDFLVEAVMIFSYSAMKWTFSYIFYVGPLHVQNAVRLGESIFQKQRNQDSEAKWFIQDDADNTWPSRCSRLYIAFKEPNKIRLENRCDMLDNSQKDLITGSSFVSVFKRSFIF